MARKAYRCSECKAVFTAWEGQCGNCDAFGTLDRDDSAVVSSSASAGSFGSSIPGKPGIRASRAASGRAPQRISQIKAEEYARISTGIGEFDRVLGGGLVPGGVILLAGAPGAGKSSLSMIAAKSMADQNKTVLIISGEETEAQIASRAARMGALSDNIYLLAESNLTNAMSHITSLAPDVIVIDSMQTLVSENSEGRVGSPAQVAEVANDLTQLAKTMNIPAILIGHITKDGAIAGPRVVEHLVDVVLYFEGSKDSPLKLLRGIKNRYGESSNVGCFVHTEDGLEEVIDPSGFFLSDHEEGTTGFATSILIEGNRALPIEIQALVTPTKLPNPRKISHGLDNSRVIMIQAILEKHGRLRLNDKDVYVSTAGGLATKDSSIDLAIAAAIISSVKSYKMPDSSVFLGETSLTGEIRPARDLKRRTGEAERLGFKQIVMPKQQGNNNVANIRDLIRRLAEENEES
jgi:DNA repair protein RadA/Sms